MGRGFYANPLLPRRGFWYETKMGCAEKMPRTSHESASAGHEAETDACENERKLMTHRVLSKLERWLRGIEQHRSSPIERPVKGVVTDLCMWPRRYEG